MSDDVQRNLNNFARCPGWTAVLTDKEVEELIDTAGSWTFCNGSIRDFVFDKITDTRFKVSTKAKEFT